MITVTVIVPTHNPNRERLSRTLAGLTRQTLPAREWETVLIDNASVRPISLASLPECRPGNLRIIREPSLGLTAARIAGFRATQAALMVLVDDDNVLAEDYLAQVVRFASTHPDVGVWGGRSLPEYAIEPPAWFNGIKLSLGCRDFGDTPVVVSPPAGDQLQEYPSAAPIGAGMALRREAADAYLAALERRRDQLITDRHGSSLSSGGDCDIVLCAWKCGWSLAYDPRLRLTHLIPARRLSFAYLCRMAYDSDRSWVQLLHQHSINPWPAIAPATLPIRQTLAFFRMGAWRSKLAFIAWRGACGKFSGQASLAS